MLISKTPFRISLFGGGTDYPIWYKEHGGAVLATSIDKYCYITCRYLPPFFDYKYRIRYSEREEVNNVEEINHPSVRECLKHLDFYSKSVEIQHNSDLPARIGLGSSSAFTVGLLHALHGLKGEMLSKNQLAMEAIDIEQNKINEHVGSQDQTLATFGGFNKISFLRDGTINVIPITISKEKSDELQSHLMLFFTGIFRTASEVAKDQIKATSKRKEELTKMCEMVDEGIKILHNKDTVRLGALLHDAWQFKRSLTNKISNSAIDKIYEKGIKAGAIGGKLLGAGAGGCMLFFVESEKQQKVKDALHDLLYIPFKFEREGSQIIYYAPESY